MLTIVILFLSFYLPVEIWFVNEGRNYGTRDVLVNTFAVLAIIGLVSLIFSRLIETKEKKKIRLAKIEQQVQWEKENINNQSNGITKSMNKFYLYAGASTIVLLGIGACLFLFTNIPYAYTIICSMLMWALFIDLALSKLKSETNEIKT